MNNLTLFLSISLLTACGASNNSSSQPDVNSAQLPTEIQDLKGSWQEPCKFDEEDNDSSKGIEIYSGDGISFSATNYIDSDCSIKELSMKFTASINYAGEKILNSGQTVKKVGALINTDNILVLLHDESLQAGYIANNTCNRTDWNSGEYINISTCYEFTDLIENLKKPLKSIYYVDDNESYWGDSDSQDDANGFPTQLDAIPNTKI
jgi:hypothetical protein